MEKKNSPNGKTPEGKEMANSLTKRGGMETEYVDKENPLHYHCLPLFEFFIV